MNHAIEHKYEHNSTLVVTPRKKVLKNSLLYVHNGLVLFKLKKFEYAIEKGQSFWIPADCLTSLTIFPNSEISKVDVSVRLKDAFPVQAGYVHPGAVSSAILTKLATQKVSEQHSENLLRVIRDELTELTPELNLSPLSQKFTQWSPDSKNSLSQELQLSMKVREARKLILSGTKKEQVIEKLFAGASDQFEQITTLILGESL
ncbi:AraC family transcriptional regulator [Vibrio sp. HN007]|uniref:AraC family transcriptional regulator n=1 Tax=Vibrio iocasae TaxID=3098914 RepID=UPI0035D526F7